MVSIELLVRTKKETRRNNVSFPLSFLLLVFESNLHSGFCFLSKGIPAKDDIVIIPLNVTVNCQTKVTLNTLTLSNGASLILADRTDGSSIQTLKVRPLSCYENIPFNDF